MFDSHRLPLTAAYFASLPQAFESFPECQVVRDAFEILLVPETELGGLHAQGLVSHEFVDRMRKIDGAAWVPEVYFQCMAFIMVDLYGRQAYLDWSENSAHDLYAKPLLRHLIRLLSPTLVVMGAASRWAAVRKGSTLAAGKVVKEEGRHRTQVTLSHPAGVYGDPFFEGLCRAFGVAVDLSRGKETRVLLLGRTETEAQYDLSWTR